MCFELKSVKKIAGVCNEDMLMSLDESAVERYLGLRDVLPNYALSRNR